MVYVHMTPPPTHTTAATISLEQTSYIVREGEGPVMVCISITQGQLSGVVGVQLATMEGTASKTTLCTLDLNNLTMRDSHHVWKCSHYYDNGPVFEI